MAAHNYFLKRLAMRRFGFIPLIMVLVLVLRAVPGRAQTPTAPLVVFVLDKKAQTASLIDPGPDGLTKLAGIFQNLGARTENRTMEEGIPDDAAVVVIVRPWKQLPVSYIARLWVHMQRGNHVLLALDPIGQVKANPESAKSGFMKLATMDYGIQLLDTFVAEPWFTHTITNDQRTSFSRAYPDVVSHPVIDPLIDYDMLVQTWGARSMRVEPFGPGSYAIPLLDTHSAYAEANLKVFDTKNLPAPFEINLDRDTVGNVTIGALAESTKNGSRLVILGDSEIVQNDFGLAYIPNTVQPLFPGNMVLTQRLAAWLLELPIERWPSLPNNFTWIRIDGNGDDWKATLSSTPDSIDDGATLSADIQRVRAFRNLDYLYLSIETAAAPDAGITLQLNVDTNLDRTADTVVKVSLDQITAVNEADEEIQIPDGRMRIGQMAEVRLPLRVVGTDVRVHELCLLEAAGAPLDCLDEPPYIQPINERAPYDLLLPDSPLAIVQTNNYVNLRSGPSTSTVRIATVYHRTMLLVTGRNEAGDWLKVYNASHSGWIATSLVIVNCDVMALPVVDTPAS
jgi:hypothetical protein